MAANSADADGTVRLWDPFTGRPIGLLLPSITGQVVITNGTAGVAFSSDSKLLASADKSSGTVQLWDPVTGQPVGKPLSAGPSGVNGIAFSPDGRLLAIAGSDGTVQPWEVPLLADPYAALCADVGLPTQQQWDQYAPGEPQPNGCFSR